MDFVPFLRAAALALLCLFANAANAVEETQNERCISLMRIASVEVLDSQHLLFHMHGRKNYLNVLPHRCPGLSPLSSCGLGRFSPMLDSDIDAIKDNLKTGN